MTRVLMTADAVGGVWTYALELARALQPHGVAVTLATMGPRPAADQLAAADGIPGLEIVSGDFKLEWTEDPWTDVAAAGRWLLDLESRVQPAVVHLNGYAHGALPWRAPVVVVGHSCVLSWAEAVGETIDASWRDRYRDAAARGLGAADWVAAPSATMLHALQRHYGPLPRASVIANGRDAGRFRARSKERLVFTAGRIWDRAKNIETVVAIAPRLSWPVVVAGAGDASGGHAFSAFSASSVVHTKTLGRLSESAMAEWLGRASIFVLPARYEPFGLLPVEAALAGCALVLGDTPSLREVWGDAADFVDPGDGDGLAASIERLIDSPDRLAARMQAAHSRALEFTSARMASGYLRLYRCAAGHGDIRERMRCAS